MNTREQDRREFAARQRAGILRNYGIEPVTEVAEAGLTIIGPASLSDREVEVMEWYVVLGTQKNIGPKLGISAQTVKNHATSAYRKVGATTAIDFFRIMGWLRVPDEVPPGSEPVPLTDRGVTWSIRLR